MTIGGQPRLLQRAAMAATKIAPALTTRAAAMVAPAAAARKVSPQEISRRLDAALRLVDEIDLFVSPSASLAAEYRKLGLPAGRIIVSDNGMAPALSNSPQ